MAVTRYRAYGSVLEALSKGLYPDKKHVIREFVQNAYDALYDLRTKFPNKSFQPIHVKIAHPSIFIADTGIGMNESKMLQYQNLGYSEKEKTKHAGFRGIGKYSGLAVANKIIVDSSPIGVPEKYRVVIDVEGMIGALEKERNPPLEELLERFTSFDRAHDEESSHYTFVELHGVRKDAAILFDIEEMKRYLARNAPVPLNPEFPYEKTITEQLTENVPEYFACPLELNGDPLYKPFFKDCRAPGFELIFFDDKDDKQAELLAFCWYSENKHKGQFDPRQDAGLVYRVKNIAVGNGLLSREALWETTGERAFYFFGEIHVLDKEVIPSSDRTDFEDNAARRRLYDRCKRIATVLSKRAGEQSQIRRFDEIIKKGNEYVSERAEEIRKGDVPVEVKETVVFDLQTIEVDINRRMRSSKSETAKKKARQLLTKARKVMASAKDENKLFDIRREIKLTGASRSVYETIIEVLKKELSGEPLRLERIVKAIHRALRESASA